MVLDIFYYTLLVALVVFAVYYIYDWHIGEGRMHAQWLAAIKDNKVTQQVRKAYNKYSDKQRFLILWLQVNRLKHDVPEGAFAELGVYRGESAAVLKTLAPERELLLFDTFEGFRTEDLEEEEGLAASYSSASFADTSAELVSNRLGNAANVHIFKGNFADVIAEIPEKKYALVSIDVDLAKPTLSGLIYFYPRLLPGGVIIIHDYNPKWVALMNAVDSFLETIPEVGIEMPDKECSLLITKAKDTIK